MHKQAEAGPSIADLSLEAANAASQRRSGTVMVLSSLSWHASTSDVAALASPASLARCFACFTLLPRPVARRQERAAAREASERPTSRWRAAVEKLASRILFRRGAHWLHALTSAHRCHLETRPTSS
jgi:hypothetical protein